MLNRLRLSPFAPVSPAKKTKTSRNTIPPGRTTGTLLEQRHPKKKSGINKVLEIWRLRRELRLAAHSKHHDNDQTHQETENSDDDYEAKLRRILCSRDLELLREAYLDLELTKLLDRQRQLEELKIKLFYVGDAAHLEHLIHSYERSTLSPAMETNTQQTVPSGSEVAQYRLRMDGIEFEITRSQKDPALACSRKCLHCFDTVDAIVFVVPLPAYNQTVEVNCAAGRKTITKNRMQLELERFRFMTKIYRNTPVLLLLTNKDEFRRQVVDNNSHISDQEAFVDYFGKPRDASSGLFYFIRLFKESYCHEDDVQELACSSDDPHFFYETCKGNPNTLGDFILDSTKTIIMTDDLYRSGYLRL